MALNRLRWVGCIFYTKIISILFFYVILEDFYNHFISKQF